jgi:hypothetical protein
MLGGMAKGLLLTHILAPVSANGCRLALFPADSELSISIYLLSRQHVDILSDPRFSLTIAHWVAICLLLIWPPRFKTGGAAVMADTESLPADHLSASLRNDWFWGNLHYRDLRLQSAFEAA